MYLKITSVILALLSVSACSSSSSPVPEAATPSNLDGTTESARYRITFTAQWDSTFGTVPSGAHFTTIIGSAVTDASTLWARGETASAGLEDVAEDGTTSVFGTEIATEISNNTALKSVSFNGTGATDTSSTEYTVNRSSFNLFTFATMIAPTPDWFVGLSKYNLLDSNGLWITDETIPLRVYDAGTEDGNGFSRANPATSPQGVIHRLNETIGNGVVFDQGLVGGTAIATVRFQRIQ